MKKIRLIVAALGLSLGGVAVASEGSVSAWPYNCSTYITGGTGTGYCASGTGIFRVRVVCSPQTATSPTEVKYGQWRTPGAGYHSAAFCDSSHPRARSATVVGSN